MKFSRTWQREFRAKLPTGIARSDRFALFSHRQIQRLIKFDCELAWYMQLQLVVEMLVWRATFGVSCDYTEKGGDLFCYLINGLLVRCL